MPLAERVAHFVEQRGERAVAAVAEINAQRIEAVAENARHAQEPDGAAVARSMPAARKMPLDLLRAAARASARRDRCRRSSWH